MCFDVSLPEPRLAVSEKCRVRPSVAWDFVASHGGRRLDLELPIVLVCKIILLEQESWGTSLLR